MTLSFSTKWPDRVGYLEGKPNYFIEKIWAGLKFDRPDEYSILHNAYNSEHIKNLGQGWDNEYPNITRSYTPKLHTIRHDPHNRWKAGNGIHFVINNRTKDRFQFAPVMECKSVQDIEITPTERYGFVRIDGRELNMNEIIELALNDGFPSVEAFFQYFNEDFKGKLIHWTDLRY